MCVASHVTVRTYADNVQEESAEEGLELQRVEVTCGMRK
jgi:hypothetical protein